MRINNSDEFWYTLMRDGVDDQAEGEGSTAQTPSNGVVDMGTLGLGGGGVDAETDGGLRGLLGGLLMRMARNENEKDPDDSDEYFFKTVREMVRTILTYEKLKDSTASFVAKRRLLNRKIERRRGEILSGLLEEGLGSNDIEREARIAVAMEADDEMAELRDDLAAVEASLEGLEIIAGTSLRRASYAADQLHDLLRLREAAIEEMRMETYAQLFGSIGDGSPDPDEFANHLRDCMEEQEN